MLEKPKQWHTHITRYLHTYQMYRSPSEIKDNIFKEQINQLATQLNGIIKPLNDRNEKLKQEMQNSKILM